MVRRILYRYWYWYVSTDVRTQFNTVRGTVQYKFAYFIFTNSLNDKKQHRHALHWILFFACYKYSVIFLVKPSDNFQKSKLALNALVVNVNSLHLWLYNHHWRNYEFHFKWLWTKDFCMRIRIPVSISDKSF